MSIFDPRVTVVNLGEDLNLRVEYDASSVSPDFAVRIDEAAAGPFLGLCARALELLKPVLISWDLTHDDGTVLPPSDENLDEIPMYVLYGVLNGIAADVAA